MVYSHNSLRTDKRRQSYRSKVNSNCTLTRLDRRPMHVCDEDVNIRVSSNSHDKQVIFWWSCRYGILNTPQINPSADRVNKTPKENTHVEMNVAMQL